MKFLVQYTDIVSTCSNTQHCFLRCAAKAKLPADKLVAELKSSLCWKDSTLSVIKHVWNEQVHTCRILRVFSVWLFVCLFTSMSGGKGIYENWRGSLVEGYSNWGTYPREPSISLRALLKLWALECKTNCKWNNNSTKTNKQTIKTKRKWLEIIQN